MDIIYRANDGKEFDSEDECIDYERKIKLHTFKMWDVDANPLSTYDDDSYSKVFYLHISNEEELDDVIEQFYLWGIESFGIKGKESGFYLYDTNTDQWLDCDKLLKQYREEIDKIMKVKEDGKIH